MLPSEFVDRVRFCMCFSRACFNDAAMVTLRGIMGSSAEGRSDGSRGF